MDRPIEDVQWRDFELYERVRIRQNRKRFFILSASLLLFFGLCAVPVVKERLPKWRSLRAAREILVGLERLKSLSIHEKKPVRLRFVDGGRFVFEILDRCSGGVVLRTTEPEVWTSEPETLGVLNRAEAARHSVGLASDELCFDPVFGLDDVKTKRVVVVVPVKDLTEGRLDRASYVILEGESAKISIN